MIKLSKSSPAFTPSVQERPCPINFISKVNNMDKVYGTDADKNEWNKLEFIMDPDNPAYKNPNAL
jgi:hypothetical protein